jgi:acyl-coenzyme A synthetase/AMP-(fatty) acid ligase
MHTIRDTLKFNALWRGEKRAFVCGDRFLTFGDVEDRSYRLACDLTHHGEAGDRVAIVMGNHLCLPEIVYACALSGRIANPINPKLAPGEISAVLNSTRPSLIVSDTANIDRVREVVGSLDLPARVVVATEDLRYEGMGEAAERIAPPDRDVDAPFLILNSSGTTGTPKGIIHSERSIVAGPVFVSSNLGITCEDVYLQVLPLATINFIWLQAFFVVGATTVLLPNFTTSGVLSAIDDHAVTRTVVAPVMMDLIISDEESMAGFDGRSLTHFCYGGSGTPAQVVHRALAAFGAKIQQTYGQTEVCGLLATKMPDLHDDDVSAGLPLSGVDLRIVDARGHDVTESGELGEVQAKVDQALIGYWNDTGDHLSSKFMDGWFRTGDTGRITEQGRLVIVGRADDMIISGGHNVFPREIEAAILDHEGVIDTAVLGIPDEKWGSLIVGFVVLDPAQSSLDDLVDRLSDRIARYKTPRRWVVLDEIPRSSTGKVQRGALLDTVAMTV